MSTTSNGGNIIGPLTPPADEITIIPQGFGYAYAGHLYGTDALTVHLQDRRLGNVSVMLTTRGAMHVAEHLLAMVADVDELRAEYDRNNHKEN